LSANVPFDDVVACGDGNGVGHPSFSGVIDVAGCGVGPHGAHGINFTATPGSGLPVPSSTTVPLAFVVVDTGVGVVTFIAGGTVPPVLPPPPHAASAAEITTVLAIKRKFMAPTPPLVPR
jgi:hypothetical protein